MTFGSDLNLAVDLEVDLKKSSLEIDCSTPSALLQQCTYFVSFWVAEVQCCGTNFAHSEGCTKTLNQSWDKNRNSVVDG